MISWYIISYLSANHQLIIIFQSKMKSTNQWSVYEKESGASVSDTVTCSPWTGAQIPLVPVIWSSSCTQDTSLEVQLQATVFRLYGVGVTVAKPRSPDVPFQLLDSELPLDMIVNLESKLWHLYWLSKKIIDRIMKISIICSPMKM